MIIKISILNAVES